MATDIQALIDYYTNLLIIQYNQKTKARAMIAAFAKQLLANGVFFDVRDGYNIDTAVGKQLDVIGKYVGLDRFYGEEELDGFFAFSDYDETTIDPTKIGFSTYSDYETWEGKMLTYDDVITKQGRLIDDDYRFLLKLKIILNNSNFSHKEIDDSLWRFFGNDLVADSTGNMIMDFFVTDNKSTIIKAAIAKSLLPNPMGVWARYLISGDTDFFGLGTYADPESASIGFSSYADYDTLTGVTATYGDLIDI